MVGGFNTEQIPGEVAVIRAIADDLAEVVDHRGVGQLPAGIRGQKCIEIDDDAVLPEEWRGDVIGVF